MNTFLKSRIVFLVAILIALLLTACNQPIQNTSPQQNNQTSAGNSGKKTTVIIGTAGSSGTYYAVGAGMAQILEKYSSKLQTVSQGTNGAIENVRLVNSGNIHVGFGNWDALYFGHSGEGPFKGQKQKVAGLMTLYLSGGQMAVKADSPIKSYQDLKGKKVNLGPPGSTITEMSKIILKTYGVEPEKDIKAFYLDFNEGGNKLKDGDLDATFYVAGIPTAGLIDLSNTAKIRLLSLDKDISDKIIKDYPYYDKLTIKAGTYKGVDYNVETLQLWTALMVNPDMPQDVAYEIVKTLMEHLDEFKKVHQVGNDFSLENAAKSPIPMHSGAAKYYQEKGLNVK